MSVSLFDSFLGVFSNHDCGYFDINKASIFGVLQTC